MDNSQIVRLQSRFLLLTGVSLICNVFIGVFSWIRRSEFDSKLHVDEVRFYDAVSVGTSNFLSSVSSDIHDNHESRKVQNVTVVFCDLGTWSVPSGDACMIDGNQYRVGDYCDFGLIVGISSGRVYVDSSDGMVVLRRRASSFPDAHDAPASRGRARAGDEEG